ncbi:MAG: DNA mismatch repair endonuclease MutL [Muribaculaceae bacterium]|nr:DNA mismatch repair endonuclease MutL [Muribaculaceae bacterium]
MIAESKDIIRRLPESVANCIAAGEVIQRPASVIKELVENSVDAGATSIKIILKDGGKALVQVIDDGCGMSAADARLAFEKHATSKIRKAEDMFALHTMGFRGEALPSIAAVSEVEMRTMLAGEEIGTKIVLSPGQLPVSEPCVCTRGTNIMVKNLFCNFPARRRFLGKDTTELTHITKEFERLALINTDIRLELNHNGSVIHQLSKASLKERIGALFGKTLEQHIIPVETATNVVRITGFIGLPSSARRRNALQYFFVNGRNMLHRFFHKAVQNCYKELIAADAKPNFFINFDIDPSRIDVNVHPQKHEIKFEDEQLVCQILTAAIKESLSKYNVAPGIDFDVTDVPDIPPCIPDAVPPVSPVADQFDPGYTPFMSAPEPERADKARLFNPSSSNHSRQITTSVGSSLNHNWDKLYKSFNNNSLTDNHTGESSSMANIDTTTAETMSENNLFGDVAARDINRLQGKPVQIQNRYIISDSQDGMMIIDQYRAHVAILYAGYKQQIDNGNISSQHLFFEERIELTTTLSALLVAMKDEFAKLGFTVEQEPNNSLEWNIRAIPATLEPTHAANVLRELLTSVDEQASDAIDVLHQKAALSIAKSAAMRGQRALTDDEIARLISDLYSLPSPNYTVDGLPVTRLIKPDDLAKMFSR